LYNAVLRVVFGVSNLGNNAAAVVVVAKRVLTQALDLDINKLDIRRMEQMLSDLIVVWDRMLMGV
jgi:hypothetical protein